MNKLALLSALSSGAIVLFMSMGPAMPHPGHPEHDAPGAQGREVQIPVPPQLRQPARPQPPQPPRVEIPIWNPQTGTTTAPAPAPTGTTWGQVEVPRGQRVQPAANNIAPGEAVSPERENPLHRLFGGTPPAPGNPGQAPRSHLEGLFR